ncbi:MAG: alpha/beta hydrolase [Phycisphaerales bacterium]
MQRPPTAWRRRLKRITLLLAIGYAGWCTLLYSLQTSMLFPRGLPNSLGWASRAPDGFESWKTPVPDGSSVEAWYMPGEGRDAAHPGPAVMYFHGNAELIDHAQDVARWYARRGVGVVLVEFRGYGRSGGTPSQQAILADSCAFYDTLAGRPEVDPSRIFVHGRSVGGGPAAQLTTARKAAAIVLNSTFTSVPAMARRYVVPPFLVRSPFRTDEVLEDCHLPVLIAHGTWDDVIPFAHGQRLASLAPGATFVPLRCAHNDFPGEDGPAYEEALEGFLRAHALMD